MQSITILVGLTDQAGNALPAQLLAPDSLTANDVLLAMRQAEGQAIANALAAAERRGRRRMAGSK